MVRQALVGFGGPWWARADSVTERLERRGFHSFIDDLVEFSQRKIRPKGICVSVAEVVAKYVDASK